MRWQAHGIDDKWRRWFAWYPVLAQDGDEWIWLEWVERREYVSVGGGGYDYRVVTKQ